jgi:hypothetical protein
MSGTEADLERRRLLQGLLGTGVAGCVTGAAAADAAAAMDRDAADVLLVVDDSPLAAAFGRGVRTALSPAIPRIARSRLDGRLLSQLARRLRRPGLRVLGFCDDAFGVLLIDAARGSGAQLHWQANLAAPSREPVAWAAALGHRLASSDDVPAAKEPGPGRHFTAFVIEVPRRSEHGRA